MLNVPLGDATLSGIPSTGMVQEFAKQTTLTSIAVAWEYTGAPPENDIWFLLYLNGRLLQRLPGSSRETEILAASYDRQHVVVIPWPKTMEIQQDWYGSVDTSRAHLEWTRSTDTEVAGYHIRSTTDLMDPFEDYVTHDTISLQTGIVNMGSGTLSIAGNYNAAAGHTNTMFTVEVISDDVVEITNDKDSVVLSVVYATGIPFVPIAGGVLTIDSDVIIGDSASFLVGVQPFYDTSPLPNGTTYFDVGVLDLAGNISTYSSSVPVTVTGPPEAPQDVELSFQDSLFGIEVRATGLQSSSSNATYVFIYTNYDANSNALLPNVFFDVPFSSAAVSPNAAFDAPIGYAADFPDGILKVVVRAINDIGISDGNAVVYSVMLPYVPEELPVPLNITYESLAGGDVKLTWLTSIPAPAWVFADTYGWFSPTPEVLVPEDSGAYLSYSRTFTYVELGSVDGLHLLAIQSSTPSGSYKGYEVDVEVISDSTPPASVSGLTGVAF